MNEIAISNRQSAISKHRTAVVCIGWLLIAGCWLLMQRTASACPGCKEALFDPSQLQQKLSAAKGYALTIGLMLTIPAALVGGMTALIVRAVRQKSHL